MFAVIALALVASAAAQQIVINNYNEGVDYTPTYANCPRVTDRKCWNILNRKINAIEIIAPLFAVIPEEEASDAEAVMKAKEDAHRKRELARLEAQQEACDSMEEVYAEHEEDDVNACCHVKCHCAAIKPQIMLNKDEAGAREELDQANRKCGVIVPPAYFDLVGRQRIVDEGQTVVADAQTPIVSASHDASLNAGVMDASMMSAGNMALNVDPLMSAGTIMDPSLSLMSAGNIMDPSLMSAGTIMDPMMSTGFGLGTPISSMGSSMWFKKKN